MGVTASMYGELVRMAPHTRRRERSSSEVPGASRGPTRDSRSGISSVVAVATPAGEAREAPIRRVATTTSLR